MAVSPLAYHALADQLDKVMDLNVPEINQLAKKIAFYNAKIDAAEDDPMDDPEDQTELLQFLKDMLKVLVEDYQRLVNQYV